ncbi:thioredoxin domain-containing protein [Okibacterium fritillariae]|uniref:thioredoxin domain-containing protein n=1 Tax=Okibacterium fritillariae TaxID=123320 RepID=UPI00405568A7
MTNRLATAISPYLRQHAENPVNWYPWGEEAFAEAKRRDVPLFVSIGYSTCHWCHVMARESFSDEGVAAYLDQNFVAVKVDREEHPDVDASYLAAAGAFTPNLGWPLSVFVTPDGGPFFAGTYYPPVPIEGHPSFSQVLQAVTEAWTERRDGVEETARQLTEAIQAASDMPAEQMAAADAAKGTEAGEGAGTAANASDAHTDDSRTEGAVRLPAGDASSDASLRALGDDDLARAVRALAAHEDPQFGGLGTQAKFPVAPVVGFLVERADGRDLADRMLRTMASSPLRDDVEGGFFRYATQRDWSDPHYERMLYDNALLLDIYATRGAETGTEPGTETGTGWAREAAEGIGAFLLQVMQLPTGGFASAQDSESVIDGQRVEGGYYGLDAAERASQSAPALDEKVLTGWNGLAIGALARAGRLLGHPEWIESARWAADYLLENHVQPNGKLVRASVAEQKSDAAASLEDYGMLAGGLLELGIATGQAVYFIAAQRLVDATLPADVDDPFVLPEGGDPLLGAHGLAVAGDPSEGAYPSGPTSIAQACWRLYELGAGERYRQAAERTVRRVAPLALANPVSFGATLALAERLRRPLVQLVVVVPDAAADASPFLDALATLPTSLSVAVSQSAAIELGQIGLELFAGRTALESRATAYLCQDFVCRLPVHTAEELAEGSGS